MNRRIHESAKSASEFRHAQHHPSAYQFHLLFQLRLNSSHIPKDHCFDKVQLDIHTDAQTKDDGRTSHSALTPHRSRGIPWKKIAVFLIPSCTCLMNTDQSPHTPTRKCDIHTTHHLLKRSPRHDTEVFLQHLVHRSTLTDVRKETIWQKDAECRRFFFCVRRRSAARKVSPHALLMREHEEKRNNHVLKLSLDTMSMLLRNSHVTLARKPRYTVWETHTLTHQRRWRRPCGCHGLNCIKKCKRASESEFRRAESDVSRQMVGEATSAHQNSVCAADGYVHVQCANYTVESVP